MIGILFDYNGVLVDDEALHEAAFRGVLAEMGATLTSEDYVKHCMGRTDMDGWIDLRHAFPDTVGRRPIEELFQAKKSMYKALLGTQDILYPGVPEVLEAMASMAVLVLVTSALRDELFAVLDRHALRRFFKGTVTADDVERGKPDPEGYVKGLALLQLPKDRVVVVEDAPSGVKAAKAASLRCIGVLQTRERTALPGADRYVGSIKDLTPDVVREVLGLRRDTAIS